MCAVCVATPHATTLLLSSTPRPAILSNSSQTVSYLVGMDGPLPVVLCGKTEQIGAGVIAHLKPEFEGSQPFLKPLHPLHPADRAVTHFVLTADGGKAQIPAILRGDKDVPTDSSLGSRNFEKTPVAILLGAGYDDEAVENMREAAKGTKNVPWLRPDVTKPAPPLGPEYGKALVARIKDTIRNLADQGKLEDNGAVVWY